jgi:hypothetical protein
MFWLQNKQESQLLHRENIKLLNYCTTHPEATLRYHASYMILNIHNDASYLSEREAISRAGGFFYMGSNTDKANKLTNGAILIISTVLKHVMSSAAEAETGIVFLNAKGGTVLCTTLEEVGHPHPPTPLQTENTAATGYSNGTLKKTHTGHINTFIGSNTGSNKDNFMSIGAQDTKIWGIILRNTIRERIIKNARNIYSRERPTDELERNSRFRIARVC